jgi:sucrose-6-phosphatase
MSNPFLIVTDLDSTLVGNNTSLREFNRLFQQHRQSYGSKLVYATGRSLTLYEELESEVDLLPPDMLITSVGSEIYNTQREMDSAWANLLSEDWDVQIVRQIADKYDQLRSQRESEQGSFKVSFWLDPHYKTILQDLKEELMTRDIQAQIIYSSDRDVDVLPRNSGKGNALRYIREQLNIPPNRTVACGDSGNDIALFTENTFGIIVGNARAELIEWYRTNQRTNLHLAHSNCAAGILEGLRHFKWLNG